MEIIHKFREMFHKTEIKGFMKDLRWIDYAMILFFASRFLTSLVTGVFGNRGIYVTMGILGVLYIGSLIQAIKKKERDTLFSFFLFFFSLLFLALWTMTFNKEAMEWMLDFNYGLFTKFFDVRKSIYALFVILLVRDPKSIQRNLKVSAWLMTFYLGVQTILYVFSGTWASYYVLEDVRSISLSYNLSYGYEMIFVSIVFLCTAFFEKKKAYYYLGGGTFLLAFLLGSRGIMLPFATFLLLIILLQVQAGTLKISKRQRKIFFTVLGTVAGILLVINLLNLISGGAFQVRTGIRNIDMFLSLDFTSDNGRTKIWSLAWDGIKERFPFGYGVFGDRPFVGRRFIWGYAHNYFLEMILSFGVVGLLLSGLLVFSLIRGIFFTKNNTYLPMLVVFTAMNSKLLISDTFWFYDFYWGLLGILFLWYLDHKKKKRGSSKQYIKGRQRSLVAAFLLVVLIIGNVFLVVTLVKDEVALRRYRTITFEQPTVVVALESVDVQELKLASYVLDHREIPYSAFVDFQRIDMPLFRGLQEKEHVDVHISFGSRSLGSADEASIMEYVESAKTISQIFFDQGLRAAHTTSLEMHPGIVANLRENVDAFILREARHNDVAYYRSLKDQDFYKLRSLNGSVNDWNYRRLDFVQRQIISAAEENAFIMVYFSGLALLRNELTPNAYSAKMSYFTSIINLLEEQGFQFVTLSEVLEEARLTEDEKTLRNFMEQSDLYQKLRRTNE